MNEGLVSSRQKLTKFRVPFIRGLDRWRHARLRRCLSLSLSLSVTFGHYATEIPPRIGDELKKRVRRTSDREKG